MFIAGSVTIKHSECTVTQPAGSGCKIKNNEIIAEAEIKSVTTGEEMYEEYRGKKEVGKLKEIFAEFTLQECLKEGKNPVDGTYFLTGVAIATPHGATIEFLKEEPKSTLKLEGNKAEYLGEETIRMKSGQPLSPTTTES